MVNLPYVGPAADPTLTPGNLATRSATTTAINTIVPSKASVSTQVAGLVGGTYATQTYIDTQDQSFVLPSYYQNRDLLNIPGPGSGADMSGAANGVATLDSGGKLPMNPSPGANQVPNLGVGYILGPFGTTAVYNSDITTSTTKVKFAEWNLGVRNIPFRPLVFMSVLANSLYGQPIIEVRITDSTTSPATYASAGTLVAQGLGRYVYNAYHAVDVVPVPDTTGTTPSNLDATYRIYLTAWIWDATGATLTMATNKIANAAVFLMRGG